MDEKQFTFTFRSQSVWLLHHAGLRGEVWSDEAQDSSFSRLLVSKVPGISCRVRDVAEVCVILDVGLQRGAGVNTASYIHSAISLSIKTGFDKLLSDGLLS